MTILDDLVALDLAELKREHTYLTQVRDWARASLGLDYTTGDRVEIINPKPSQSKDGWRCYAEALAIGQSGIAGDISFNSYANGWYVLVGMDRTWSTHTTGLGEITGRYWNGPPSETPEGFKPAYDRDKHPEGKVKHFSMPVSWVRSAAR